VGFFWCFFGICLLFVVVVVVVVVVALESFEASEPAILHTVSVVECVVECVVEIEEIENSK